MQSKQGFRAINTAIFTVKLRLIEVHDFFWHSFGNNSGDNEKIIKIQERLIPIA
jgi:hypothetical protein